MQKEAASRPLLCQQPCPPKSCHLAQLLRHLPAFNLLSLSSSRQALASAHKAHLQQWFHQHPSQLSLFLALSHLRLDASLSTVLVTSIGLHPAGKPFTKVFQSIVSAPIVRLSDLSSKMEGSSATAIIASSTRTG